MQVTWTLLSLSKGKLLHNIKTTNKTKKKRLNDTLNNLKQHSLRVLWSVKQKFTTANFQFFTTALESMKSNTETISTIPPTIQADAFTSLCFIFSYHIIVQWQGCLWGLQCADRELLLLRELEVRCLRHRMRDPGDVEQDKSCCLWHSRM